MVKLRSSTAISPVLLGSPASFDHGQPFFFAGVNQAKEISGPRIGQKQ
jgi:hypothetical protein